MNVFLDQNQTAQSHVRSEPLKVGQAGTTPLKRFGQTVNANLHKGQRSRTGGGKTQHTTRDATEVKRKKKRTTQREPEVAHLDDFNRQASLLSQASRQEMSFWASAMAPSSFAKRQYTTDLDSLLKKEAFAFGSLDLSDDLSQDEPLDLELENDIDADIEELLAGL